MPWHIVQQFLYLIKSDNSEGKIVKMFISTVIESFGGFVFNSENMHKTYIICPDVGSKKN